MKNPCLLPIIILGLFHISQLAASATPSSPSSTLWRGSSLSGEDVLISPDKSFTCGFYKVGTNAYTFSIWFSYSMERTLAWTANRDYPVNGHGSRIGFQSDGSIVLKDADDVVVWSTNTSWTRADRLQLLDTGNLVAEDSNGKILWQSFGSPTDTLLSTQPITKNIKLVSAIAKGSKTSGYYSFYFDNDNVLRLIYEGPEISSIYWPNPDYEVFQNGRTKYNSSRYGVLDEQGKFAASDGLAFNASDMGLGIQRRLTLDYDGNLRLYSLMESTGEWSHSWVAFQHICPVHGTCGKNGVCTYKQSKPVCSCPLGYEMSDPTDWKKGCQSKFNISCEKPEQVDFIALPRSDFWGYDLGHIQSVSLQHCKNLCKNLCSCTAIQYKTGSGECYPKSVLFNGRASPDNPGSIYLKLSRRIKSKGATLFQVHQPSCNATEVAPLLTTSELYTRKGGNAKWTYLYLFVSAFGLVEILFIASGWWFMFRREQKPTSMEQQGYKAISSHFRKFIYKDLQNATGNFKDELGRGGSGTVYKGVLDDNRVVAVKKLVDVIQGEQEFWAEVRVIGSIYHMNLVRIWGFSSDGPNKLLVYEYVQNGSLDKHLFSPHSATSFLSWDVRYKIVVGVAKALAYLHHECLEWIIHCDVKPENILLDNNLKPKMADFGLAKLSKRGGVGSSMSHIRGTRGYMAPEWTSNLPITAKVDVYSYGVVLLEVITGRRVSTWMVEEEADADLTGLVRMMKANVQNGGISWVGRFIDARLEGKFDVRQALLMIEIAISCLQDERRKRPTMDSVAQLLLAKDEHSSPGKHTEY